MEDPWRKVRGTRKSCRTGFGLRTGGRAARAVDSERIGINRDDRPEPASRGSVVRGVGSHGCLSFLAHVRISRMGTAGHEALGCRIDYKRSLCMLSCLILGCHQVTSGDSRRTDIIPRKGSSQQQKLFHSDQKQMLTDCIFNRIQNSRFPKHQNLTWF